MKGEKKRKSKIDDPDYTPPPPNYTATPWMMTSSGDLRHLASQQHIQLYAPVACMVDAVSLAAGYQVTVVLDAVVVAMPVPKTSLTTSTRRCLGPEAITGAEGGSFSSLKTLLFVRAPASRMASQHAQERKAQIMQSSSLDNCSLPVAVVRVLRKEYRRHLVERRLVSTLPNGPGRLAIGTQAPKSESISQRLSFFRYQFIVACGRG